MGNPLADLVTLAPTIGLTTLAWAATTLGYAALTLAVGRWIFGRPTLRAAILFFYSMAALHLPSALVTLNNIPAIPSSNQNQGNSAGLFDIANMVFLALVLLPQLRTYRDGALVGARLRASWVALGVLGGVVAPNCASSSLISPVWHTYTYMNSLGIGLLVTLLIRMNRQKQHLLAYVV
jgi:hypothetical protein